MPNALTQPEKSNQRNAVLAGFLGWTLDAFDFFILTLVVDDIAKSFGHSRPDIAFALTVTLAMRPIGAIVFGNSPAPRQCLDQSRGASSLLGVSRPVEGSRGAKAATLMSRSQTDRA